MKNNYSLQDYINIKKQFDDIQESYETFKKVYIETFSNISLKDLSELIYKDFIQSNYINDKYCIEHGLLEYMRNYNQYKNIIHLLTDYSYMDICNYIFENIMNK